MSIIFTSNEAERMWYSRLTAERAMRDNLQRELEIASYNYDHYPSDESKAKYIEVKKQMDDSRWLVDCQHILYSWQENNSQHRITLVSFCKNDAIDDRAYEFSFQHVYVDMDSFTNRDGEVSTWHKDAIPMVFDKDKRGMYGGIIDHARDGKYPRWSVHT